MLFINGVYLAKRHMLVEPEQTVCHPKDMCIYYAIINF